MGWRAWLAVVATSVWAAVTKIGWHDKQRRGLSEARGGRRGPENVWGSAATGAFLALLIGSGVPFRALATIGFGASFAAKLADTFGSEVGKRWGKTTVLITSFQRVEPGTEGAISLEGTLASVVGSVLMTAVLVLLNLVPPGLAALVVSVVGLLATLVESVIGAVAQDRLSWLSNELVNAVQTLIAALLAMAVSRMLNLA